MRVSASAPLGTGPVDGLQGRSVEGRVMAAWTTMWLVVSGVVLLTIAAVAWSERGQSAGGRWSRTPQPVADLAHDEEPDRREDGGPRHL